jgi:hypothetical protein
MATNAGRLSLQAEGLTPSQSLGPAPAITPILLVSANGRTWSPGRAGDSSQPAKLPAGATISARDGTGWVAAGRLAQAATVWTSTDGVHWRRAATLVGAGARPRGICVGPAVARPGRAQLTVVGSVNVQPSGTAAAAWTAVDGVHWGRAVLSPAPVVGIDESVDGCEAAAGGFLGYGSTAGSGGLVPAVWKSASGQAWSLDAGAGFAAGSPAPLTGMARSGGLALAVGRSSQGGSGLWLSTDGGGTWPIVTTTSPPWDGYQKASFEAVGVIADELVVTGSVDGRLAAWLGTPAA